MKTLGVVFIILGLVLGMSVCIFGIIKAHRDQRNLVSYFLAVFIYPELLIAGIFAGIIISAGRFLMK